MNKTALICILFVLFSCNAGKKSNPPKENIPVRNESNGVTEFEFNEEMHNFGSLQAGEIVIFTFVFTNTGENNLQIDNVEADCGCVKVNFLKEPVLPGNSGTIEIEFYSSGLFGKQFKTIEIYANTKKPKQIAIFAEVQNEQIEIKY
jgi:hypothetical protein